MGILSAVISGFPIKYFTKKFPNYYKTINSIYTTLLFLISILPIYFALYSSNWYIFIILILFLMCFLASTNVPINLLLLDIPDKTIVESKNYCMALSICFMHLFGDIPSPIIVGKIWDYTKNPII